MQKQRQRLCYTHYGRYGAAIVSTQIKLSVVDNDLSYSVKISTRQKHNCLYRRKARLFYSRRHRWQGSPKRERELLTEADAISWEGVNLEKVPFYRN